MDEYTYEYVKRLHDLIIPKLQAYSNSGDGSIIHTANHHIGVIKGWESLYNYYKDTQRLVTWREYIRTAEMWLIEKGKEK